MKANDVFEPSTVDASQDYKLLLGYENVTHTVMRFVRRLDTCDDPDDVPIGNDTMRLILVHHADDPHADAAGHLPGALLSDAQMAIRAVVPLRFTGRTQASSGGGAVATSRRDVRVLELRAEAVALPAAGDLLEWCRVFELTEFGTKHHMVKYEPVFGTEQGRRQLDALVLYECQGAVVRLERAVRGGGGLCAEFRQTRGVVCEAVVASWTRGSAVSVRSGWVFWRMVFVFCVRLDTEIFRADCVRNARTSVKSKSRTFCMHSEFVVPELGRVLVHMCLNIFAYV